MFAAFSYFDKDGSGYITQDELQQACEEFGIEDIRLEEIIREIDQDNVSFGSLFIKIKLEFIIDLLRGFIFCGNFYQDGRIDYNEFVAMMQMGNPGIGKKGLQNSFSIGFREALKL